MFLNRAQIDCYLEEAEKKLFKGIAKREHKSESELLRRIIAQYIKDHGAGNDNFTVDNWLEDPNFQVVPALFSDREKWINYYKNSSEKDRTQLRIVVNDLQKIFRMVDINE
jgi:ribbon-helix-helix CopG family protein